MLSKLSFSSEDVAKISENPFKNLKTLVDDLKVQVNKGKGKTTSVKVILESRWKGFRLKTIKLQLTGYERTEFRKNGDTEEAKRSAAIGLIWKLLKEEKVKVKSESNLTKEEKPLKVE